MARVLIAGGSGMGKSWEVGRLLENVVPSFSHGVHLDLENEEVGLAAEGEDGSPPIFKTLYLDEQGLREWNIPETIRRERKLRVVPDGLTDDEQVRLAALICHTAMQIGQHEEFTFHFSVDEAHDVLPKAGIESQISRLLTGGRKRGIEWAVATQRLQNIHEDAITQASNGIYFGMGGRDAQKVDGYTIFDAKNELPQLEQRECIHEDRDTRQWTVVDTDSRTRAHPHQASDDGIADEYLAGQLA